MKTIPDELVELTEKLTRKEEISYEVWDIVEKIYNNETLAQTDRDILVSPTEAAAILSAKYRRTINHRYVKELTRNFTSKDTGHITPARLSHARIVGGAFLYKVEDVLNVRLRERATMSKKKKEQKIS